MKRVGAKLISLLQMSAFLCSVTHAKELPTNNSSFVDSQLKILEKGESPQLEAFSFFQQKGQQSLLNTQLITSAIGNLDRSQQIRLENIDRMHASMEGTLLQKKTLEKISAILNVKSEVLLKFVENNPGFGPQFHELLLVLETGSGPQGPQFNRSIINNLKENINAWLDLHYNDDLQTSYELQKVSRYLVTESENRLLDFNLQQSEKFLAMLEADEFWNSKVAYIPDLGESIVEDNFTLDAAGNAIPIVLSSPENQDAGSASASLKKTGNFENDDKNLLPSDAPAAATTQSAKTEKTITDRASPSSEQATSYSGAGFGFSHLLPKIYDPKYTDLIKRPGDVFDRMQINSAHTPQRQEQGDLCARFGIDCPQTANSTSLGSEIAGYANYQNFLPGNSPSNSSNKIERESLRRADLDLELRTAQPLKIKKSQDEEEDTLDDSVVTKPTQRAPASKKPTKPKPEEQKPKSSGDDSEEVRKAIPVEDKDPKPEVAKKDQETPKKEEAKDPTDSPESFEVVKESPKEKKAKEDTRPEQNPSVPLPLVQDVQPAQIPDHAKKQFEVSANSDSCNEKEAQKMLAGLYKDRNAGAGPKISEEVYWTQFFRHNIEKVKEQRVVSAKHCSVSNSLSPACQSSDRDLESAVATLHLANTLTASDSPACDLIQGKLNTGVKKDEKYCFNLNNKKALDSGFSKVVAQLLSQSFDELSRIMDSESPSIKELIRTECGPTQSYLAKSLCMNKLLSRLNTDFIVKGREKKENRSFLLDQIQNCTQPGQIGYLVQKKEKDLREIARQCGSWEARLVTKLVPSSKDVNGLNEALNLPPTLAQFLTTHHFDLLEESEKSSPGYGENTLPFSKTDARFLPLIDVDPKAPQSKAIYSIYNFIDANKLPGQTSPAQNERAIGRLEKMMRDLASNKDTDFKLRNDLQAVLSTLQKDKSQQELERDLRLQCHQYILPRYSYLVGTLLHSRHVSISNNGKYSYPGAVVGKQPKGTEIRRAVIQGPEEMEHDAQAQRKPAGDLSLFRIDDSSTP